MAKKVFTGVISSTKMQKTVVVTVSVSKKHPLYGKVVKKNRKFKAHVPENKKAELGKRVIIESCSPISRDKKWIIKEVL